jgi:anti-anti-sigma regulatory factor
MIAPVYQPLPQVDSRNIGSFQDAVTDSAERYGKVVVDCSCVVKMGVSAMRILEVVSREAQVTIVNPNPAVRLMATAFGLNVEVQGAVPEQ